MAQVRGFQGVLNGNANGAGIVLPDSQTENYAIDQIAKNGLLNQQQAQANKAAQAQTAKDFANNQLKISPGIQYRNEVNGLAQQWYDKGIGYRKQGFDPFNPDYSKDDQVKASQEYLNEKQHIENIADLAKEVDTNYTANQKAVQDGKLAGWDDYQNKLKNTKLVDLYNQGGINALPQLYKPFDTNAVDEQVKLKPQVREVDNEVAPGVTNTTTEHYVNMPQAARSAEAAILNQPGVNQHLKEKGIDNVKSLYTLGGHNMITDPNNPEEFGHIDEPGIFHQMATDYLTKPDLIKQLPADVKQNIIKSQQMPANSTDPALLGKGFMSNSLINPVPYNAANDPSFKKFISQKFDDQIGKEKAYQDEIAGTVARKLPSLDLGSTSKLDATMANLALRRQTNNMGWERLDLEKQNHAITAAKWGEHLADAGTREKWINDIQNQNPDAVASLQSAVKEVNGSVKTVKGGLEVHIPETVPNFVVDRKTGKPTSVIDQSNPKRQTDHFYKIDKFSGRPGRIQIEQVINKLPTFGKEKGLKTEPYAPTYNNLGSGGSADDL